MVAESTLSDPSNFHRKSDSRFCPVMQALNLNVAYVCRWQEAEDFTAGLEGHSYPAKAEK
jgi:hypothetical protein